MHNRVIRWIALVLAFGMVATLAAGCAGTQKKSDKFKLAWQSTESEPIGITINKDDTKFWENINATIDKLKANGKIKEFSMKWFGEDITASLTDGGSTNVKVDATKDKTYQKTKIVVGVDDSYPPMEFVDADGKTQIGFDLDFARALFKEMGMEVSFESTAWSQIFNGLTSRKFDVIISSTSINADRMANFLQSKPYVSNKIVLLTRDTVADITDLKKLDTMKICSQSDTTADELCQSILDKGGKFTYTKYDLVSQALDELSLGRVDGVMVDIVVAQYYMVQKNK